MKKLALPAFSLSRVRGRVGEGASSPGACGFPLPTGSAGHPPPHAGEGKFAAITRSAP